MTKPAHVDQQIIERRMRVAQLRLGGVRNQRTIASRLGVSVATINRDFKALDAEWKKRAADDIDVEKAIDLDRTERLIASLWEQALKGKWLATDRIISLMQHRARLLGLDAPQKREDTHTVNLTIMAEQIAAETGLDKNEIMAEAQRIITAGSTA
jgi:AcrR family transcriptional regulator